MPHKYDKINGERYAISDFADCCRGVSLRRLFNLLKLLLTIHCWWIYTVVGVTDCSRTQLSDLQSLHCCRNLKQISCARGVVFFCPAKLDKHCNYSFKFRSLRSVCEYSNSMYTLLRFMNQNSFFATFTGYWSWIQNIS